MVTVTEALQRIESTVKPLGIERIALTQAYNRILAETVLSPIDMPPFRQSAMDGYALRYDASTSSYRLVGEVAAGSAETYLLKPGEAVRIFTGAGVPDSADTVVQQEHVIRQNDLITFNSDQKYGQHIRAQGEQIKKGTVALAAGSTLNPAAIGFLATLGISEIAVFQTPNIAILTTGDELVEPGNPIKPGQVYESNSIMLSAALQTYAFNRPDLVKVPDTLEATRNALEKLLHQADVILISGGISVGDYDFVKPALEQLGVTEHFHKIRQKPGKPIYYGSLRNKVFFGLPGNPASALTCFYMYVLPALNKLRGQNFEGLRHVQRKLQGGYTKKAGLAHFLKSQTNEEMVWILNDQSSAMLNTFSVANAITFIPEETETIAELTKVDVYLL